MRRRLFKLLTGLYVRDVYFLKGSLLKESPFFRYSLNDTIPMTVGDSEIISRSTSKYASDVFNFPKAFIEEINDIPSGTKIILYSPTTYGTMISYDFEKQEATVLSENGEEEVRDISKFDFIYIKEEENDTDDNSDGDDFGPSVRDSPVSPY